MKYKEFTKKVRQLYRLAQETMLETSQSYYTDNKHKAFIFELVQHTLKDIDLDFLEVESKRIETIYNDIQEQCKLYHFDVYKNQHLILNKRYFLSREMHKKIHQIQENFEQERWDFGKAMTCGNSDYHEFAPAHNWRLCKLFNVKPTVKVNPRFVIEDKYIDKITATYFDLIRHGIIIE